MKKMKKITALMLSVMTCAASLSAMTSNAALCYVDESNYDEFLSNWTEIDESLIPRIYNKTRPIYINNDPSVCFPLIQVESYEEACISFDIKEVDFGEMHSIIKEVNPYLEAKYCSTHKASDFEGYGFAIYGLTMNSEANESYEPTLEDAKKVYEAFKEKGWVEDDTVRNIKFWSSQYTYEEGGFNHDYITAYDIENKEVLEKYVSENNLNCHMEEDNYNNKSLIKVVPDYEITPIDHFRLSQQIYNDTGISIYMWFNEDINSFSSGDVNLMNNTVGDANEDGKLDMSDAVYIMQCCSNPDKYKLTAQGRYNADFNDDGITNEDALTIQKTLLEIE